MKTLFTLLLGVLLLCPGVLLAQTTVSGTVTDNLGETLVGASVLVEGTTIGTVTDIDGKFSIEVPEGSNTLVVSYIGYQDYLYSLEGWTEGMAVEVKLAASEMGLDQVVISGSRRKEKILDAPASITLLEPAEIKNNITIGLQDNVKGVAGVDYMQTGLTSANITTRGFNNVFSGSLLTLVDNRIGRVPSLRVNAFQLIPTSNEDIERIEIVRGPASALYGPNAASGVMHMITKSPLDIKKRYETTLSLAGGIEQSIIKADVRHVGKIIKDKLGYKVSFNYSQGHDFKYDDPAEPDSVYIFRQTAEGNDTIEGPVENGRNTFIRTGSVDGRLDYRITKDMELILSGGIRQGNNVEMTGLGASQVINWKYSYAQARFLWKDLFAQFFINSSNSGDTYLLRTGGLAKDKSKLYVGQIQHRYEPIKNKLRFIYGFDALMTRPDTDGTINGKNEDNDNFNEFGLYIQGDYDPLPDKLSFVGAIRADYHTFVDGIFWSPRAGIVYKPAPRHTVRATYNRAFESPTSINVSLDVLQGIVPVSNIPVRAIGNPNGFGYSFANNPYLSDNPLYPQYLTPFADDPSLAGLGYSSNQFVHLNDPNLNNVVWEETKNQVAAEFDRQLEASGSSLAGLSIFLINAIAPDTLSNDVGNVLRELNLTEFTFGDPLNPATAVSDREGIKNAITQTYEIGYKGMLFDRWIITFDVYRTDKKDFISPLTIVTPNVFLDPEAVMNDIGDQLFLTIYGPNGPSDTSDNFSAFGLSPDDLIPLLDMNPQYGNNDGLIHDELIRIFSDAAGQIPFGTVSTTDAGEPQMFITYVNIGDVTVYGIDLSSIFYVTEDFSISANYSWLSEDTIAVEGAQFGYVSLNAPKHKLALGANYNITKIGLEVGARWRWQDDFLANSSVYVGPVESYSVLDLTLNYQLPFSKNTEVTFSMQNVLDNNYRSFPGAPRLGRMTMLRVLHTF